MRNSIFRVGRFLTVMTTLLALLVMATSAQAARFRRSWDPLFNATFSSTLGWRGEAEVFVSDSCVSALGSPTFDDITGVANAGCLGPGSANLESYLLEFYNILSPGITLDSASDSAPGSPLFPAVSAVSFDALEVASGVSLWGEIEVAGIFTFPSSIDFPTTAFTAFMTFGLDSTSLRLAAICGGIECPSYFNDAVNNEPEVEWSQVPTPAPLALLGIGLLALSLSRRRKA
jgi:hypothetical protein